MPSIKDSAIVLRRLDYSETSQVLAFFTRAHGQRRLIAKGVKRSTKKKFAVGIDLLERGDLVFWHRPHSESNLETLTEWRQTELYLGLRESLDRWYAAQYAADATAGMTQEADPHPELYDALHRTLSALASGGATLPVLIAYQKSLLAAAGLMPDLSRCVICGREAPPNRAAYYSAQQGGLVCRNCQAPLAEKRLVTAPILSQLRTVDAGGPNDRAVFELLDYTISFSLGRRSPLADATLAAAMQ